MVAGFDADRLEPDVVHTWPAAGGDQQSVTAKLPTVLELQHVLVAVAPSRLCLGAEHQFDAVPSQHLAEGGAERRRLVGQHMV